MVDDDVFERRLADALLAYAVEASTDVDSVNLARAIARDHPRRSRWWPTLAVRGRRSPLLWVLAGALLILAWMLALAATGSRYSRHDDLAVDPGHPIPIALFGQFEGNGPGADEFGGYAMYVVDFNAPSIVRLEGSPSLEGAHSATGVWGSAERWAGRAVAFFPSGPGAGELVIRSEGPCADARYRLDFNYLDLRFTPLVDACPARVAILMNPARPWSHQAIPLVVGERYDSWFFTEPFHFVMPVPRAGAMPWLSPGNLRIGTVYWSTWFLDDQPVQVDVCDPAKGRLPDVPATPEAVGAWLRSSSRMTVSEPIEVTVDGRTALRFDTEASEACESQSPLCQDCGPGPLDGAFMVGFRIYAIPTGDDTILYAAWSDAGGLPEADAFVESLVRSMTFD